MKIRKSSTSLGILFGCVFLLSSCSAVFMLPKTVDISHPEPEVKVKVLNTAAGVWFYEEVAKPKEFVMDPNSDICYPIQYSKKGYYPSSILVTKTKNNYGVPIDLLALAGATYYFGLVDDTSSYSVTAFYSSAMLLGAFSSIYSFADAKYFDKSVEKPKLKELPIRNDNQKYVELTEIEWNIKLANHQERRFRNPKKFEKGDAKESESTRDYKSRLDRIYGELNYRLGQQGFIDTTSKVYANSFSPYAVKAEIVRLTENYLGPICTYSLGVRWKLVDNVTDKVVHDAVMTTESMWGFNVGDSWNISEEMYLDCLSRGMFEFISSWSVNEYLLNDEDPLEGLYYDWGKIKISDRAKIARNLNQAKQAVVSLVVEGGHGSAFFISEDGYLVSNYHIIRNENLDSIFVMTLDGKKHRAELIRANPVHDLILLKVDYSPEFILRPGSKQPFDEGTRVYAVGSPEDLDLIQTMTRGIISSERRANGRTIIQSDVSINAGNSGGALLDEYGNLLGVLNAKWSGIGVEGISFAVPAFYIRESLKMSFQ